MSTGDLLTTARYGTRLPASASSSVARSTAPRRRTDGVTITIRGKARILASESLFILVDCFSFVLSLDILSQCTRDAKRITSSTVNDFKVVLAH